MIDCYAFVQEMAQHPICDQPLANPKMTQLTDLLQAITKPSDDLVHWHIGA